MATVTDTLSGNTPPWWAQYGSAVTVCIIVIVLTFRYLLPKVDAITASQLATHETLKEIRDDNKQISTKQLETENRLLNLLENMNKGAK